MLDGGISAARCTAANCMRSSVPDGQRAPERAAEMLEVVAAQELRARRCHESRQKLLGVLEYMYVKTSAVPVVGRSTCSRAVNVMEL